MPFYIRKSFNFGPLRINLSKSGGGASAGVTGFRIGTGPKGHHVHGGHGGLYFRKKIRSEAPAEPEVAETAPEQSPPKDGLARWLKRLVGGR